MKILRIKDSTKTTYNDFVAQNDGSFLQSYEWGQWQESQGRKVYRYLVKNDNENENKEKIVSLRETSGRSAVGMTSSDNKNPLTSSQLRGQSEDFTAWQKQSIYSDSVLMTAQFIEHSTPFGKYLYCPYGPITDSRLTINDLQKQLTDLLHKIREDFPNLLFIRLEPTLHFELSTFNLQPTAHIQPDQTLLLNISKPANELLTSFHPKTRYNIKVAEKHEVTVQTFTDVNQSVVDLIMETSNRQKYRSHYREYIEKLWNFFATNKGDVKVTGYLASVEGKSAASALMIDFAQTRMYLFGGSNYELRQSMAPYLLHWQAIQDEKNIGLTYYDFGASETATGASGGFMRFKMGFNPTLIQFGGTWDIKIKPIPYAAYTLSRKLNRILKHL